MYYFLLGLQAITTILVFTEFMYIFLHVHSRYQTILMLLTLAAWVNNAGYFIEILCTDMDSALIGTKICYMGKTFIPLLILQLGLNYCNIRMPNLLVIFLTLFQVGIWALVLTCDYNGLYYRTISYQKDELFSHIVTKAGPFYYLFILVSAAYFCVVAYFLIRQYRKETNQNRRKQVMGMLFVLLYGRVMFTMRTELVIIREKSFFEGGGIYGPIKR